MKANERPGVAALVDLPVDRPFIVHVDTSGGIVDPERNPEPVSALQWLAENAVEDELPIDLSVQHDHYLLRNRRAGLIRCLISSPIAHFGCCCSAGGTVRERFSLLGCCGGCAET